MAQAPRRRATRRPRGSFTDLAKRFFTQAVRQRGERYFADGCVDTLTREGETLYGIVDGTEPYEVAFGPLERGGDALYLDCTCPYFADHGIPCKHLWAAIRAAEHRGAIDGRHAASVIGQPSRRGDAAIPAKPAHSSTLPASNGPSAAGDVDVADGLDPWLETTTPPSKGAHSPKWQQALAHVQRWQQQAAGARAGEVDTTPRGQANRRLHYAFCLGATLETGRLTVALGVARQQPGGTWTEPELQPIDEPTTQTLTDPLDRQVASLLLGGAQQADLVSDILRRDGPVSLDPEQTLSEATQPTLVPLMVRAGRCVWSTASGPGDQALSFDEGPAWQVRLELVSAGRKGYRLQGALWRAGERRALTDPVLLTAGGLVFWSDSVGWLDDGGSFAWISTLRQAPKLEVGKTQLPRLLEQLLPMTQRPPVDLPDDIEIGHDRATPQPRVTLAKPPHGQGRTNRLEAQLGFDYAGHLLSAGALQHSVFDADQSRLIERDRQAERDAIQRLHKLGFDWYQRDEHTPVRLTIDRRRMPEVVRQLTAEGWHVEAEGEVYRQPGQLNMSVSSGIDWFELHGEARFDDLALGLPELLQAIKKGHKTVRLGDGTLGMLPEQWLERYAPLARLGEKGSDNNHLQFAKNQTVLLDALLEQMPEVDVDRQFAQACRALPRFSGIRAKQAPAGFQGELRDYQRAGLGWLHFLRRFGFGGVLADDMGLGKTIQVLALLESRRTKRRKRDAEGWPGPPSLVVAPRSLITNWQQEAARFTPKMRVLCHLGPDRWMDQAGELLDDASHFYDYDLIVTTYATMRLDIETLKATPFDYAILDEAQAIKNAATASAKAARLLQAEHRLTLSGTPIENHLGELFSLFDFLNPGMLGKAGVSEQITAGGHQPDPATLQTLSRAVKPFILRRTKQQVASELPERSEQTIYCDLESKQRRQYDELRQHYRQSLLSKVDEQGINKSKMHVLEGLLRLRQAACHPALIDDQHKNKGSAKLDTLLPQLREVIAEGHKALIFSQFTTLLRLVRDRLDKDGVGYAYLDGRTRKRSEKVEHFQSDPDCAVFLISLKAGGLGLNLTAASYVFLLDPWWNPAVEAQAIDRTHRIGQHQHVSAYRLIARDTVEEKVLELQNAKRELADAIVGQDTSPLRDLSREDLRWLLS
jgi:superfamily II DNA or RNA helicase